jgi:hypothetical protein
MDCVLTRFPRQWILANLCECAVAAKRPYHTWLREKVI